MIQTVFNGETVFVVNEEWSDGASFDAGFALIRDTQTSLTRHESRRPYSGTLRVSAGYGCYVLEEDLRELIGQLRELKDQSVVIPFWPAIAQWQDRAGQKIKGGLMIVWKDDWSQLEIYEAGSEPGWPAAVDSVAPALMGFLKPSEPKVLDTAQAWWKVDFVESSPAEYALQVSGSVFAAGPQPAGYGAAPTMIPWMPDYSDSVGESLNVRVERSPVGLDREQGTTFYPHDVYRGHASGYTLEGLSQTGQDEIADLLKWFVEVSGPGESFWGRGSFILGKLALPALAGATTLHLEETGALRPGDWIVTDVSGASYFAEVNTIVGNDLFLVAALGVALPSGWPLSGLHLARLDKPQAQVRWRRPGLATVRLQWTEVRPEAVIPFDETLGTTIGKLAERVVFFQFVRDFGNGTVSNWYYTSFEEDINWGGHNWVHAPLECGDISQSLNLEDDVTEIRSFIFAGNPLVDDVALQSEAPLSVTITFADWDGAAVSNAAVMFKGDCTSCGRDGNKLSAKCRFGPGLFETQLPRFVRGKVCNHLGGSNNDGSFLISAGCTLTKANFKFTAVVANPVSGLFPATLNVATLVGVGGSAAVATVIANYFANGWVEWGAGAAIQRRMIIGSTVPAAGALALTLHRYFRGLPNAGDALVLYPGCDGLFATCKAYNAGTNPTGKFNNIVNFGAEPFTPVSNPSTTGLPQFNTDGAKK